MRRPLLVLATALAAALSVAGPGLADVQPNDPAWLEQWAPRKIGLPRVWESTTGDPSIVIATIDTGVNEIPDLAGALAPGWDFVENDAIPQDVATHGTRVAAVIAARGNNGIGMAGHCWGCRIMPVRVTAGLAVNTERIAAGIVWAVDHGARIINVSLSRTGLPDDTEAQAVKYAIDRGVLVVASAGNAGDGALQYPAAYPGVVSVAATDDFDQLYFWSSRGPWVALAAPGCHMIIDTETPPGTLCGTSFTPAAVAGVAGLILSKNPSLTSHQVIAALQATARPVSGVAFGRIDARAAFEWLGLLSPAPAPPAAPRTPAPGQLYAREAHFETGSFRSGFRTTFKVGKGRLQMQLVTPLARDCSLSLRSAGELIVALPALKNLLSLSVTLTAGRYTAAVRCRGTRSRQFTLGVIGMFPRASP